MIEGIKKHDWLRRRAGILESVTTEYYLPIIKNFFKILTSREKFFKIKTTDFTTNSRYLLRDMLAAAIKNGLEIFTNNELLEIKNSNNAIIANCSNGNFQGKNMAVCLGGEIEKFSDLKINKSYAPIAVVKNIKADAESFVELDIFKKNCINIVTKGKTFGLIGGISLSKKHEVQKYFDFMINEHKKINPKIEILWDHVMVDIVGDDNPPSVTGAKLRNVKTSAVSELKVDGIFVAIGHDPATAIFKSHVELDEEGYIVTKADSTATEVPGVFAAGDVKDKVYRQAVTAAGMGCMAALEAEKFVSENEVQSSAAE